MTRSAILLFLSFGVVAATFSSSPVDAGIKSKIVAGAGVLLVKKLVEKCLASHGCREKGREAALAAADEVVAELVGIDIVGCIRSKVCLGTLSKRVQGKLNATGIEKRRREVANARRQESEGRLKSPGYCSEADIGRLSAMVTTYCKTGERLACRSDDDSFAIQSKISMLQLCQHARINRESQCFRGGDFGHRNQIADMKRAEAKCWTMFAKKQ